MNSSVYLPNLFYISKIRTCIIFKRNFKRESYLENSLENYVTIMYPPLLNNVFIKKVLYDPAQNIQGINGHSV